MQNAPSDTETIGLTYNVANWNIGYFNKRIGKMFNDDVMKAFVDDFKKQMREDFGAIEKKLGGNAQ